MKFLPVVILLFSINSLFAQKKKYTFLLPQCDTFSFRPTVFGGTFKNSTFWGYVKYKKDFDKPKDEKDRDFLELHPNLALTDVHTKPDGFRMVRFRFQFYDSSKMMLDTTIKFPIDLLEGYAIPPDTDIQRFSFKLKTEPQRLIFTWSFYDRLNPSDPKEKVFVWKDSQLIELYKYYGDYGNNSGQRNGAKPTIAVN